MRPSSSRRSDNSESLQPSTRTVDVNEASARHLQPLQLPTNVSVEHLFSLFVGLAAVVQIPGSLEKSNWLQQLVNTDVGTSNLHSRYVGSGASFTVRTLRSDHPEPSLALKSAMPSNYRFTNRDERRRLADIILELRALSHPPLQSHRNVVGLMGLTWETDSYDRLHKWPVLVIEYADGGSLSDLLHREYLTEREKIHLYYDIASGIDAIHSCGIIHGDMKPQNILMFQAHSPEEAQIKWIAKIGDFGGAIMDAQDGWTGNLRTPSQPWNAPEWMERLNLHGLMQTDVYSLGLVFWNIAADGANPFTKYADSLNLPDPKDDTQDFNRAVQELKSEGLTLITKLNETGAESFASEGNSNIIKRLLSVTVQRNPEHRSLHKVLDHLVQVLQDGISPSTVRPERMTITSKWKYNTLETLEDVSNKPSEIDTLDPTIRSYALQRLEYTAIWSSEKWQKAAAAFTLATEALASGADTQSKMTCLKWLVYAAELGHSYAQSLAYRFYNAFDVTIPAALLVEVKKWTWETSLKGYSSAQEDLSAMFSPKDVQDFRGNYRFRYAGIGRNSFSDCYLENGTTIQAWDLKWSLYVKQKFQSNPNADNMYVNDLGDTILHFAACAGLHATVEVWLTMRPADVNHQGHIGETPLLHACRSGHYHVVCLLLEAGADPRIANHNGDTPLHWILSFDPDRIADVTSKLLAHHAHPNAAAKRVSFQSAFELNYEAGTPLHRAVGRCNLAAVHALLQHGADAMNDGERSDKFTPLNLAAMFQDPEILEVLLDSLLEEKPAQRVFGSMSLLINVLKGQIIYGTGFDMIARHGSLLAYKTKAIKCLEILLQRGAEVHLQKMPDQSIGNGSSALFIAIPYCDLHIVKYLLQQPNVSSVINDYCKLKPEYTPTTPLDRAMIHQRLDVFSLLLDYGADATAPYINENDTKLTYLYQCAMGRHADASFAQELISRGLLVDAGPAGYETPFACAVRNRCFVLASFLLEKGANLNVEFSKGFMFTVELPQTLPAFLIQEQSLSALSCLDYLFDSGRKLSKHGPVSFLVSESAKISVLHKAASVSEYGRDNLVCKLILERVLEFFKPTKKQVNMLDANGRTALAYATKEANVDAVELLLKWGADPLVEGPEGQESSALYILLYHLFMLDHGHHLADFIDDQDPRPSEEQLTAARRRRKAIESIFRSKVSEDNWLNFV